MINYLVCLTSDLSTGRRLQRMYLKKSVNVNRERTLTVTFPHIISLSSYDPLRCLPFDLTLWWLIFYIHRCSSF